MRDVNAEQAKPFELHLGDCIEVMRTFQDNSVDAIVTDPPYGLEFMGKEWDGADGFRRSLNLADAGRENVFGRASRTSPEYRAGHLFQEWCEVWAREALRVLKPGGHLLAFSGSRTYHRMTCAIEDAGFEVRDQIMWVYGSGFPKSLNVSKAIDKEAGAERRVIGAAPMRLPQVQAAGWGNAGTDAFRDARRGTVETEITAAATPEAQHWEGWGTALKPAHEPICVARKPLVGTVAANVLAYGTGALNVDACRVPGQAQPFGNPSAADGWRMHKRAAGWQPNDTGRWPANLIHDGSDVVLDAFPDAKGRQGALTGDEPSAKMGATNCFGKMDRRHAAEPRREEGRSAARFFYCAKASKEDRDADNMHPTVKPTELMAYLVRLVTPPGGLVLDPFMGSGSTGKACMREGFRFIGIDMTPEYVEIARARIDHEWSAVMAAREAAGVPAPQRDLFEEVV